jgi:Na+-driven multidrug efflux pump
MLFGLTQGFTGIAIVLSNSLQGAGNTRFVMVAELAICGGIYLPITYLVGLRFGGGLLGAWSGEYVYWSLLALAMTWKFRQGTWKGIQI